MRFFILLLIMFSLILCAPSKEKLSICDPDDCKIVGISNNGKKYIVLDGCGRRTHKVRPTEPPDSSKIGQYLIILDEFDK